MEQRSGLSHRILVSLAVLLGLVACADKPAATSAPTNTPAAAPSSSTATVCTPGMDQSCNDNPEISSLHGTCNPDRTCICKQPFQKRPKTGECL